MRLTLDSVTMDKLLTIIRDGGIVLYNGYFLAGFSADVYAKNKGVWVDCAVEHKGDVEYSDYIKQGTTAEFLCFMPCLVL